MLGWVGLESPKKAVSDGLSGIFNNVHFCAMVMVPILDFGLLQILIILASGLLMSVLKLRKVLLFSVSLTNNAASFVNTTAKDLHIMRIVHQLTVQGVLVAADSALSSLDEVPTAQIQSNDSRAHISGVAVGTGTFSTNGGLNPTGVPQLVLNFRRGDLVLEPDEAIFMNNVDGAGTPTINARANIWYDD